MSPQYTEKVMDHFTNPRNVGEIPDADGVGQVGNPVCLAEGTMIQLNNHLMGIEDVHTAERVLTHEGVYSHILQKSSRDYDGDMIRFTNKLGSTEMTPDHLILAIKVPKGDKYLRTKGKKELSPDWYHADEIERRDIALYPILKEVRDQSYLDLNEYDDQQFYNSKNPLPGKVAIDDDLLRLFGFYIAEGSSVERRSGGFSCFSFHIDEKDFHHDVVRILESKFGLKARIEERPDSNVAVVVVNNTRLARILINLFGKGAENKRIPDILMFLPPEKQRYLIEGLWKGDGHVSLTGEKPRAGYSTISPQLVDQIKTILLRVGIIPSIYREDGVLLENVAHSESFRIHIGDKDSLRILCMILGKSYESNKREAKHSWIENGFLHTPITAKDEVKYSGRVYNFEVDCQHSYATKSFICHNCGDLMWVYIKVKDDIMTDVRFKTFGCGAAIATSSMVTELAKGKSIQDGLKITRANVASELGGLPPQKMHCSNLAADALHEAIHDYLRKQGREPPLAPDAKKPHSEEEEECFVEEDSPIHVQDEVPKQ